eukprot:TRINITY_DN19700_c0_g1_i1.p1 TRINITY_DN19700_c0_g1~~TRINITY_DN19700_c0_g1_i1.p1  ORF type:complete len:3394 (+),score=752.34 TRINITY_DN19700_c0_g1_i1:173-10354(+)
MAVVCKRLADARPAVVVGAAEGLPCRALGPPGRLPPWLDNATAARNSGSTVAHLTADILVGGGSFGAGGHHGYGVVADWPLQGSTSSGSRPPSAGRVRSASVACKFKEQQEASGMEMKIDDCKLLNFMHGRRAPPDSAGTPSAQSAAAEDLGPRPYGAAEEGGESSELVDDAAVDVSQDAASVKSSMNEEGRGSMASFGVPPSDDGTDRPQEAAKTLSSAAGPIAALRHPMSIRPAVRGTSPTQARKPRPPRGRVGVASATAAAPRPASSPATTSEVMRLAERRIQTANVPRSMTPGGRSRPGSGGTTPQSLADLVEYTRVFLGATAQPSSAAAAATLGDEVTAHSSSSRVPVVATRAAWEAPGGGEQSAPGTPADMEKVEEPPQRPVHGSSRLLEQIEQVEAHLRSVVDDVSPADTVTGDVVGQQQMGLQADAGSVEHGENEVEDAAEGSASATAAAARPRSPRDRREIDAESLCYSMNQLKEQLQGIVSTLGSEAAQAEKAAAPASSPPVGLTASLAEAAHRAAMSLVSGEERNEKKEASEAAMLSMAALQSRLHQERGGPGDDLEDGQAETAHLPAYAQAAGLQPARSLITTSQLHTQMAQYVPATPSQPTLPERSENQGQTSLSATMSAVAALADRASREARRAGRQPQQAARGAGGSAKPAGRGGRDSSAERKPIVESEQERRKRLGLVHIPRGPPQQATAAKPPTPPAAPAEQRGGNGPASRESSVGPTVRSATEQGTASHRARSAGPICSRPEDRTTAISSIQRETAFIKRLCEDHQHHVAAERDDEAQRQRQDPEATPIAALAAAQVAAVKAPPRPRSAGSLQGRRRAGSGSSKSSRQPQQQQIQQRPSQLPSPTASNLSTEGHKAINARAQPRQKGASRGRAASLPGRQKRAASAGPMRRKSPPPVRGSLDDIQAEGALFRGSLEENDRAVAASSDGEPLRDRLGARRSQGLQSRIRSATIERARGMRRSANQAAQQGRRRPHSYDRHVREEPAGSSGMSRPIGMQSHDSLPPPPQPHVSHPMLEPMPGTGWPPGRDDRSRSDTDYLGAAYSPQGGTLEMQWPPVLSHEERNMPGGQHNRFLLRPPLRSPHRSSGGEDDLTDASMDSPGAARPSYLSNLDRHLIEEAVLDQRRHRRASAAAARPPSRGGESWQPLGQTTPPAYEQVTPELFEQYQQLIPTHAHGTSLAGGLVDEYDDPPYPAQDSITDSEVGDMYAGHYVEVGQGGRPERVPYNHFVDPTPGGSRRPVDYGHERRFSPPMDVDPAMGYDPTLQAERDRLDARTTLMRGTAIADPVMESDLFPDTHTPDLIPSQPMLVDHLLRPKSAGPKFSSADDGFSGWPSVSLDGHGRGSSHHDTSCELTAPAAIRSLPFNHSSLSPPPDISGLEEGRESSAGRVPLSGSSPPRLTPSPPHAAGSLLGMPASGSAALPTSLGTSANGSPEPMDGLQMSVHSHHSRTGPDSAGEEQRGEAFELGRQASRDRADVALEVMRETTATVAAAELLRERTPGRGSPVDAEPAGSMQGGSRGGAAGAEAFEVSRAITPPQAQQAAAFPEGPATAPLTTTSPPTIGAGGSSAASSMPGVLTKALGGRTPSPPPATALGGGREGDERTRSPDAATAAAAAADERPEVSGPAVVVSASSKPPQVSSHHVATSSAAVPCVTGHLGGMGSMGPWRPPFTAGMAPWDGDTSSSASHDDCVSAPPLREPARRGGGPASRGNCEDAASSATDASPALADIADVGAAELAGERGDMLLAAEGAVRRGRSGPPESTAKAARMADGRAAQSEEEGDVSSGSSASKAWLGSPGRSEGTALKHMMRHSKHKLMIRKLIPSFPSPEEHPLQHSAPSSTRSLRSNSSSSSAAGSVASNDRALESDRFTRFTCDLAKKIDKEEDARADMVEQLFKLQQKALEKKVREKLRHLNTMDSERSPRWVEKRTRKVRMRAEAEHAEIERQLAESKALHARRKLRISEMENRVYSWRSSTLKLKKKAQSGASSAAGDTPEKAPGGLEKPVAVNSPERRETSIGAMLKMVPGEMKHPRGLCGSGYSTPFSSGYSTPSSAGSSMKMLTSLASLMPALNSAAKGPSGSKSTLPQQGSPWASCPSILGRDGSASSGGATPVKGGEHAGTLLPSTKGADAEGGKKAGALAADKHIGPGSSTDETNGEGEASGAERSATADDDEPAAPKSQASSSAPAAAASTSLPKEAKDAKEARQKSRSKKRETSPRQALKTEEPKTAGPSANAAQFKGSVENAATKAEDATSQPEVGGSEADAASEKDPASPAHEVEDLVVCTAMDAEGLEQGERAINAQLQKLKHAMDATRLEIQAARSLKDKEMKLRVLQRQKESAKKLYEQKQDLIERRVQLLTLEQEEREVDALLDKALNLNIEEEVEKQVREAGPSGGGKAGSDVAAAASSQAAASSASDEADVLAKTSTGDGQDKEDWQARESHLDRLRQELAKKRKAVEQLQAQRVREKQQREEERLLLELRQADEEAEKLRTHGQSDDEPVAAQASAQEEKAQSSPREETARSGANLAPRAPLQGTAVADEILPEDVPTASAPAGGQSEALRQASPLEPPAAAAPVSQVPQPLLAPEPSAPVISKASSQGSPSRRQEGQQQLRSSQQQEQPASDPSPVELSPKDHDASFESSFVEEDMSFRSGVDEADSAVRGLGLTGADVGVDGSLHSLEDDAGGMQVVKELLKEPAFQAASALERPEREVSSSAALEAAAHSPSGTGSSASESFYCVEEVEVTDSQHGIHAEEWLSHAAAAAAAAPAQTSSSAAKTEPAKLDGIGAAGRKKVSSKPQGQEEAAATAGPISVAPRRLDVSDPASRTAFADEMTSLLLSELIDDSIHTTHGIEPPLRAPTPVVQTSPISMASMFEQGLPTEEEALPAATAAPIATAAPAATAVAAASGAAAAAPVLEATPIRPQPEPPFEKDSARSPTGSDAGSAASSAELASSPACKGAPARPPSPPPESLRSESSGTASVTHVLAAATVDEALKAGLAKDPNEKADRITGDLMEMLLGEIWTELGQRPNVKSPAVSSPTGSPGRAKKTLDDSDQHQPTTPKSPPTGAASATTPSAPSTGSAQSVQSAGSGASTAAPVDTSPPAARSSAQRPAPSPAPSAVAAVTSEAITVSSFMDAALPALGIFDESKLVEMAGVLPPLEEWLPAVLEAIGPQRGSQVDAPDTSLDTEELPDASMSGGGAMSPAAASLESGGRSERGLLSWVRLLADAFVEVLGEQAKPAPQLRKGWRRPGFGEPPLSRFQEMLPEKAGVSKKKTWGVVRQRLEEVMKLGGKAGGAASADADGPAAGSPGIEEGVVNVYENIDTMLEEEVCSDEASWLDIGNDVIRVKKQITQMIFADLVEETASEISAIWCA